MKPQFFLAGWCFLCALTVGCAPAVVAVPLAGQWPTVQVNSSADDAYEAATEQWTRSGSLRNGYREVATLTATLKSPAWRVARISRAAAIGQWQAERTEAEVAQARADDALAYEVVVLLTTWDRRENDLDRSARSIWSLVLIADDGTQLPSGTITRDKRPRPALRADFAHLSDFDEVYVVKFPRTVELMSASTQKIRLRMVGPEGAIDVAWVAAR